MHCCGVNSCWCICARASCWCGWQRQLLLQVRWFVSSVSRRIHSTIVGSALPQSLGGLAGWRDSVTDHNCVRNDVQWLLAEDKVTAMLVSRTSSLALVLAASSLMPCWQCRCALCWHAVLAFCGPPSSGGGNVVCVFAGWQQEASGSWWPW
jgi:hypothetical protein